MDRFNTQYWFRKGDFQTEAQSEAKNKVDIEKEATATVKTKKPYL